ncbi:hypothetical protein [Rheinheimera sp. NSM]|uniref:hypothetical protein n=1 Tax=Rheinheimera sp. NSM TaxID=3457884 RepID=UPI00403647A4
MSNQKKIEINVNPSEDLDFGVLEATDATAVEALDELDKIVGGSLSPDEIYIELDDYITSRSFL